MFRDLVRVHSRRAAFAILGLACIAGGYGFLGMAVVECRSLKGEAFSKAIEPPAFGALVLAFLIATLLVTPKAERGAKPTGSARGPPDPSQSASSHLQSSLGRRGSTRKP